MRFIACSWLGCVGRETRGPLGCAYRKRDVFEREERKKAGKCARGIFVLMTKPMKKRFLKGSSLDRDRVESLRLKPEKKENFGCNEYSSAQPRGLFFFWQRESGVGRLHVVGRRERLSLFPKLLFCSVSVSGASKCRRRAFGSPRFRTTRARGARLAVSLSSHLSRNDVSRVV